MLAGYIHIESQSPKNASQPGHPSLPIKTLLIASSLTLLESNSYLGLNMAPLDAIVAAPSNELMFVLLECVSEAVYLMSLTMSA